MSLDGDRVLNSVSGDVSALLVDDADMNGFDILEATFASAIGFVEETYCCSEELSGDADRVSTSGHDMIGGGYGTGTPPPSLPLWQTGFSAVLSISRKVVPAYISRWLNVGMYQTCIPLWTLTRRSTRMSLGGYSGGLSLYNISSLPPRRVLRHVTILVFIFRLLNSALFIFVRACREER